jgi:hypothetical protein
VASRTRPRLLLVSPRQPRQDGQGDQRRAHYALTAVAADWDVDVVSWLPDVDRPPRRHWLAHPVQTVRALGLAVVRPLSVAYVQSLAPRSLTERLRRYDAVLFMTDRAVPRVVGCRYAIDFVDDLGGAALRRASVSGGVTSMFWRWEGRRLRRYDALLSFDRTAALRPLKVTALNRPASKTPLASPIWAKIRPTSPRGTIPTPMTLFLPRNQKGA